MAITSFAALCLGGALLSLFDQYDRLWFGFALLFVIAGVCRSFSAVSLTIAAQVGKDDKMFGSVTAKDIAEGLAEQGFTVDRRKIQLAQPIKELGTFAIAIKLPREVTATIAVIPVPATSPSPPPRRPIRAASPVTTATICRRACCRSCWRSRSWAFSSRR